MDKQIILHLSLIEGVGPATIQTIMQLHRSDISVSDLYSFSETDWVNNYGVKNHMAGLIVTGLENKKILENELSLIENHAIEWTVVGSEKYPSLLAEIYMPPAVLYWQGAGFDNSTNAKSIAIVGARQSSAYGQSVVNTLVPDLVSAGCTIVSGGALGIDSIAHEATLNAQGKTIVVLGSGLLNLYPSSNKRLFSLICQSGGTVLSAFPLQEEPKPGNFPARNRIIAGLSHGCLVVQAAKKSGSLITARYALEQGREVFAVPGPIDDELSIGCNLLVQQGAKLVTSVADITDEFGLRVVMQDVKKTAYQVQQLIIAEDDKHYTPEQKNIMAACRKALSLEEIAIVTQLDFSVVQSTLFDLQLAGAVEQDFMGMWSTFI